MKFLCGPAPYHADVATFVSQKQVLHPKGNDAPVGGDALPSPDEFFGTKGDDDSCPKCTIAVLSHP